jgi:glycosyltransferase involved in cell wall biosynthesis
LDGEILALAAAGVEMFLVAPASATPPSGRDAEPGVHVEALPTGKTVREIASTLWFLWEVRSAVPLWLWAHPLSLYRAAQTERLASELIRREQIDVVHSNFGWPGGFGGCLAAAATSTPLVTTLRGMDVLLDRSIGYGMRRSRFYDRALRALLRRADRTINISDFVRKNVIVLGAPAERALTIRKGVDCERFDSGHYGARNTSSPPQILTVAGLIKRKGIDHILESLAQLAASHEFAFVAVGEGSERARLEQLSDRLGLRGRTLFAGVIPRAEIAQAFAACDIFVLASVWEAAGNVLLEAMAAGRPVVCTSSGGPPEYVVDGVTGFVVPVGDRQALASKLALLLSDPELRRELGERGRTRACDEFSYERMVAALRAVYEDVAKR